MTITQVPRDEIFLLFALQEVAGALRALDEVERLAAIRIERAPGITILEHQTIISAARMALHLAGSASRVFWPPRNKARGLRMRRLVGVPDEHGLKDRRLRNHIEHLDERLDEWTALSPRPFTAVEMVVHEEFHEETRRNVINSTLLIYDPPRNEVALLGETFDLAALRRDLVSVRRGISTAFKSLYPDNDEPSDE